YGLATPAFPFSGAFFGHQISAFLLFAAFSLTTLIGRGDVHPRAAVWVGGMLGYAVITEYPVALIATAVLLYTLTTLPTFRWRAACVLATLPSFMLLMAYDWAIAGTVFPVGYLHSERYTALHSQGFISIVGPNLPALWGITFGSFRGLFFVSPLLLLAVPG